MASPVQYQQDGNRSCLPAINFNCPGQSKHDTPVPNFSLFDQDHAREEMKETEGILASEFSKLTFQERNKAMNDLHCVGEDLEETPEMIELSLEMFDKALQNENDSFYDMAARQNLAYVEDRSFRLRFIRANFHDVGKAVSQMLHFLRNKAKYFGTECIGRDITINDFNELDRELLMSGAYHVQAERDQNGRVVVYGLSERMRRGRVESLCRVAYYLYFNVLGAIPEVQMKGLVFILYDMTKIGDIQKLPSISRTAELLKMGKSLPIRFSARHFCMKTRNGTLSLFDPLGKAVCDLMSEYSRVRTKLHYGSDLELQYTVRDHGISLKSCPINSNGALREDILNVWLQDYLKTEESISFNHVAQPFESTRSTFFGHFTSESLSGDNEALPSTTAGIEGNQVKRDAQTAPITPTDHDILLGRGRAVQNNFGNILFREFVENRNGEYVESTLARRREIISEMRRILASRGVRFLKQVERDVWVESSSTETQKKIAQLFRQLRKQK